MLPAGMPGVQCAVQFSGGHDIGTNAVLGHELQHGEVGVGLDRVADARVHALQGTATVT